MLKRFRSQKQININNKNYDVLSIYYASGSLHTASQLPTPAQQGRHNPHFPDEEITQKKQAIGFNKHVLSPYEPDFMLGWGLGGEKRVSIPAVQPSHIDCYG